jgi:exopolysaccharide biosynthesis protein
MVQRQMRTGMKRADFCVGDGRKVLDVWAARAVAMLGTVLIALCAGTAPLGAAQEEARPAKAVSYHNDRVPDGPWSIHVIKIDRTNSEYALQTMLASGTVQGMVTLSEQVKALRPETGRPIAAVNGDFYHSSPKAYYGDPQGLQISDGELISGPTDHPCFWTDASGKPHTAVVQPLFRVTWPGGSTTPFGLNEDRPGDGAVLYTPTMGPSTGTKSGGREIVLEAANKQAWLPLRVGVKLQGKVIEIRDAGDTPLKPGTMVISLGPQLLVDAPILKPGDVVQISTATTPDLAGSETAIGGGPRLVADGKVVEGWKSPNQRHPRTAIGWNDQYLFLVLVDGRQPGLSVGMSYIELAAYFQKIGCTHALNLDGGGSASMWAFGQVVSNPSEGKERPVANGLVLVKKPKKNGN